MGPQLFVRHGRVRAWGIAASALLIASAGYVPALAIQDQPAPNQPVKRPPRMAPPAPAAPAPAPAPGTTPNTPAPATRPNTQPSTPAVAPAQPNAAAPRSQKAPPKLGDLVVRGRERDYILRAEVTVYMDNARQKVRYTDPLTGRSVDMPKISPLPFETMGVVFPVVPSTAASEAFQDDLSGELKVNDLSFDTSIELLKNYAGGVRLARLDAIATSKVNQARKVNMSLEVPTRMYELTFDEKAAELVPWPATSWPEELQASLSPQLYVETWVDDKGAIVQLPNRETLEKAVSAWLRDGGIADPKAATPYRVAKALARGVWSKIRPSGQGLTFRAGTGELSGIAVQPYFRTLETGMGAPHDLVVVYVAALRQAGIPARTVIGIGADGGNSKFLNKNRSGGTRVRAWAEFALYDEAKNTYNWIPVDIEELTQSSSRPASLDQTWKEFGAPTEIQSLVPIALQFHPPTDVVAYGAPGLWGWFVTPNPTEFAEQGLRFTVNSMPIRGGDKREPGPPADERRGTNPGNPKPRDSRKP